jgi:hypothetical protein
MKPLLKRKQLNSILYEQTPEAFGGSYKYNELRISRQASKERRKGDGIRLLRKR